jgi:hypothetical protein
LRPSLATTGRGLTVEAWLRPDLREFAGQTDEHYVHWLGKGQAGDARSGVSLYRDGVLRCSPADSRGARHSSFQIYPQRGSAPLRLGTRDQGSFFAGGLADVAVYPRILTAAEIRDNHTHA